MTNTRSIGLLKSPCCSPLLHSSVIDTLPFHLTELTRAFCRALLETLRDFFLARPLPYSVSHLANLLASQQNTDERVALQSARHMTDMHDIILSVSLVVLGAGLLLPFGIVAGMAQDSGQNVKTAIAFVVIISVPIGLVTAGVLGFFNGFYGMSVYCMPLVVPASFMASICWYNCAGGLQHIYHAAANSVL